MNRIRRRPFDLKAITENLPAKIWWCEKISIYFAVQSSLSMSQEAINDLREIRKLMEGSSKFVSVSGLSAISAGVIALIGASVAWWKLGISLHTPLEYSSAGEAGMIQFLFLDAFIILSLASLSGFIFTIRKARKQNQSVWTRSSRQLLLDFCLPLAVGGVFSFMLFYQGFIGMIAPSMLIFYGLSLINASHKTLSDVRYLGYLQVILGCINLLFIGYGFLFWCIGFGLIHILYGSFMYFKYER